MAGSGGALVPRSPEEGMSGMLTQERFDTDSLTTRFEAYFGRSNEPILIAAAPGRANLIGEHIDYQDG